VSGFRTTWQSASSTRARAQQGFRRGRQIGERALLLRLLRTRFGSQVDAAIELRVETASDGQVALWAERVLSAASLAELFAD
jgi:hypothetical protein